MPLTHEVTFAQFLPFLPPPLGKLSPSLPLSFRAIPSSARPSFFLFPKHPSPRCLSFTRDGAFLAVLQHLPATQALPSHLPAHKLRPQLLQRQEASAGGSGGANGGKRGVRTQAGSGVKGGQQQPQVQIGRDMLVVYESKR